MRATGGCLAQRSPEPALGLAAEHLELTPLLDLQMRLDDGSGAVAAVPLLAMAARLLAETATAADSVDRHRAAARGRQRAVSWAGCASR